MSEREPELDVSSYDPSLWRKASDDEIAAILKAFWTEEPEGIARRAALVAMILAEGLVVEQL